MIHIQCTVPLQRDRCDCDMSL